jgi:predicted DNA-binding transcriptional regulator YafY
MTIDTTRLNRINELIRKESTGTPDFLACKLGVSLSTVYRDIRFMKKKGAPIKYNLQKQSYYYKNMGNLQFLFISEDLK